MKGLSKFIMLCSCTFISYSVFSQDSEANSTSKLIFINHTADANGSVTDACTSGYLEHNENYLSISIERITADKQSNTPRWRRFFAPDSSVVFSYDLALTENNKDYKYNRLTVPYSLPSNQNELDISANWVIFNKLPANYEDGNLTMRMLANNDEGLNELFKSFNSLTEKIPAFGFSEAAGVVTSIASTVNELFLGANESNYIFTTSLDLHPVDERICQGYAVAFSAGSAEAYRDYVDRNLVWNGTALEHDGEALTGVAYVVLKFTLNDQYYRSPEEALNDDQKEWARAYRDLILNLETLASQNPDDDFTEERVEAFSNLRDVRVSLNNDKYLLGSEKRDISRLLQQNLVELFQAMKSRVDTSSGLITDSSNNRLTEAFGSSKAVRDLGLERSIPQISEPSFDSQLQNLMFTEMYSRTIQELESVLNNEIQKVNTE